MGAMPEEIEGAMQLLESHEVVSLGGRRYHLGTIHGQKVVLVFSRWGKVAAASTAAALILKFGISELIFTGVAGALNPALRIGDVVIGRRLYQHDLDARPLILRFEIPLLGLTYLACQEAQIEKALAAARQALDHGAPAQSVNPNEKIAEVPHRPEIYVGDIASGDRFIAVKADKLALAEALPGVMCVEMEGAAVAQVCHEYGIPWLVIRMISDTAEEGAQTDFQSFIKNISSGYAVEIVRNLFMNRAGRNENI